MFFRNISIKKSKSFKIYFYLTNNSITKAIYPVNKLMKTNNPDTFKLSLILLLSLNKYISPRPALHIKPASVAAKGNESTIYNSAMIIEDAQFGIKPINVARSGVK